MPSKFAFSEFLLLFQCFIPCLLGIILRSSFYEKNRPQQSKAGEYAIEAISAGC